MKTIQAILLRLPRLSLPLLRRFRLPKRGIAGLIHQLKEWKIKGFLFAFRNETILSYKALKRLGVTPRMDEYEKRKLSIFNQLNFLQFVSALIVPVLGLSGDKQITPTAYIETLLPSVVSLFVLALNYHRRYESARFAYFILYPVITSVIYMGGMNLGVELFFILYGILSVFFIQSISQMLFSVSLSMVSYFILSVVWKNYHYQLSRVHVEFYLFNQLLAVGLIFYGLYLVKSENSRYQFSILKKNRMLHHKNLEIEKQKQEIVDKAALLQKQAARLRESNTVKNKLFSVIGHDLKTPLYALRNVFQNLHQFDTPAEEIRELLPEIVNDLNFTTGLMENLLQWAKGQMQDNTVRPQVIDMSQLTNDVLQILRLQAHSKKITINNSIGEAVYAYADRDMIHLVLRNLVSNAIKFTPVHGKISIGLHETSSYVEIFVQDTGVGISPEAIHKIRKNDYFTTKGTTNESGTGLGLMLCKEFIVKNGGKIHIESDPGKGSTFSFTLPCGEQYLKAI